MTEKPRIRVGHDGSYRLDAWQNTASGMGVQGVDKSLATRFDFYGSHIDWRTLSLMYRYDWLARKICDRPAQDAVRRWINLDDKPLMAELERIKLKKRLKQGIAWGRLYGGAALIPIVEDGLTPADPLDPRRVTRVIDVMAFDRYHLQASKTGVLDPLSMRFGEPEYYTTNNGTVFHHTRVLKFSGTDLTQDESEHEDYWGGSFIELYQRAVQQFQGSMQDVRHIMTESSIGMLKIPGLTQSVAMGGTIYDAIQKRLNSFNQTKSIYRVAGMDAEEEFDYKQRQLTGLSDLMDRFMTQVAGATDMGELILFGTSPSGLNASQEEQLGMYYDGVRNIQEDDPMHVINTILACLTRGNVPEWDYKPLLEPSDKEKSEIRLNEANAVAAVGQYAMWSPEAVVEHLNKTGHFDIPTGGLLESSDPDEFV